MPTFRWDDKDNIWAFEFINNFESDIYKLIYAVHPKMKFTCTNKNAIAVSNQNIRSYFHHASLVISDYSSLLIDASLVCSHVVMYAYDYHTYYQKPGLNVGRNNFWGYFTTSYYELVAYIRANNFVTHDNAFIKETYFTFDDENSINKITTSITNMLV